MWEEQLKTAIKAGRMAQKGILEIYRQDFDVEIKDDNSPVTMADKNADVLIRQVLHETYPSYAFLTEESDDDMTRRLNDFCWIVDPVDGTKDFVAKNGEFTTNIALAYKGEVVLGVIVIPAQNIVYYAAKGLGCFKQIGEQSPIRCQVNSRTEKLTILTSRFHLTDEEKLVMEKHKDRITTRETFGSALKACRIAEGRAEVSYRLSGGTKEWDTAASQIIIMEAGGLFVKPNGEVMKYNREDVYNRDGYVIVNRKENILL